MRNQFTLTFGSPGDLPWRATTTATADTDIAVYRPSTGTWFVRNQFTLQFGDAVDVPVPRAPLTLAAINGDYDADRVTNLAVYTASTGLWRVRNGLEVAFGEPSDNPCRPTTTAMDRWTSRSTGRQRERGSCTTSSSCNSASRE